MNNQSFGQADIDLDQQKKQEEDRIKEMVIASMQNTTHKKEPEA